MKTFVIGFCVLLLAGCQKKASQPTTTYIDPDHTISLVKLIGSPEEFDHKEIQVVGFYRMGREESAIYPSRDMSMDPANGLWVDWPATNTLPLNPRGNWVRLKGKFVASVRGQFGRYGGTIEAITSVHLLDQKYDILILGIDTPTIKP